MPELGQKKTVLQVLASLRGLDDLKQLFWTELNYERKNMPLSDRGWPDAARDALAEAPLLLAGGGSGSDFHVIYNRLNSENLPRNLERLDSTVARDFLRFNRRSNTDLYPDDWKKLPIPDVPREQQIPLVSLVDQILAARGSTNRPADIVALEGEIDRIVYDLHSLSEEEIPPVEGKG